jgi:ecotropic viral integration site 5 protein
VEEVIHLDVNRSLHLHTDELSHDRLKRFLLYYARQHPDMPYCQGMNYLAGYVLLKAKMDPSAYAIFCAVMEHHFLELFGNNFAGMRLKLYLF